MVGRLTYLDVRMVGNLTCMDVRTVWKLTYMDRTRPGAQLIASNLQTPTSSIAQRKTPQKSPGSSGTKKLSIPISFVSVLNTFGSPTRFQFF